jgi:hypothetical protein
MSFRKYGGKQFAPVHNYTSSNINNSGTLLVDNQIGLSQSKIECLSDMDLSGNLIVSGITQIKNTTNNYGDANSGALQVSGGASINQNLYVGGILFANNVNVSALSATDLTLNTLTVLDHAFINDLSANYIDITNDLTVNNNLTVANNLDISGNTVVNNITTQSYYGFGYGSLPILPSNALGYTFGIAGSNGSLTTSVVFNTASLAIPTGIWFCTWSIELTSGTSNIGKVFLGLSVDNSTFSYSTGIPAPYVSFANALTAEVNFSGCMLIDSSTWGAANIYLNAEAIFSSGTVNVNGSASRLQMTRIA